MELNLQEISRLQPEIQLAYIEKKTGLLEQVAPTSSPSVMEAVKKAEELKEEAAKLDMSVYKYHHNPSCILYLV